MSPLNIDTLNVPSAIRTALKSLLKHVGFERQAKKGANGYLFFGTNTVYNREVAVKFYIWDGDPRYHAEPAHLARINSPNVVEILDAALVDNEYAYFVTPYYPSGDLDDVLSKGGVGNHLAVRLTMDVLNGLSHLHHERLLHRDLKPQNILVDSDYHALIGDFGSVKRIPDGQTAIPGSGHALIYTPPESIGTKEYGIPGDLYQVGILLYQLLGGYLPYDERVWLSKRELAAYNAETDRIERTIMATRLIERKITRGEVVQLHTLPPWICTSLRRTISKACNADASKRYQSVAEFFAHLVSIRPHVADWQVIDGCPTLMGRPQYRICFSPETGDYFVQKRLEGDWRRDGRFKATEQAELVSLLEDRIAN